MVYPHIRLAVRRFLRNHQLERSFIAVNQLAFQNLLMHSTVEQFQITIGHGNHPVCQGLAGQIHIQSFKLFSQTRQRNGIQVFRNKDPCGQTGRKDTVGKQLFRGIRYADSFSAFSRILEDMVLMFNEFCRNVLHGIVSVVWKNIVSMRKVFVQFLFRNRVFIDHGLQILQV